MSDLKIYDIVEQLETVIKLREMQIDRGPISTRTEMINTLLENVVEELTRYKEYING